jgi:transcriptional regulator with XRE-family HTH domain
MKAIRVRNSKNDENPTHLKKLRVKANVKQSTIAKYLGINLPDYSLIERDERQPKLEQLVALEKYFGEPIHYPVILSQTVIVDIINEIEELANDYPLEVVLEFFARHLKRANNGDPMYNLQQNMKNLSMNNKRKENDYDNK